jgi:hypothetical protein
MNGAKKLSMKPITPAQLKCINTIISKQKISKDHKQMIIAGFSVGRTESSKELYYEEAVAVIKHLKDTDPNAAAAAKMRRKILYFAHEMGWQKQKNGKMVADIQRIDGWCLQFGYVKRKLDNYSYEELPKLVSQFQSMYTHYIKNL